MVCPAPQRFHEDWVRAAPLQATETARRRQSQLEFRVETMTRSDSLEPRFIFETGPVDGQ